MQEKTKNIVTWVVSGLVGAAFLMSGSFKVIGDPNAARDQAPREMCGLVVDHRFVACRNIHGNPRHHFEIAPADYLAAENYPSHGRIVAQGGSAGGMLMGVKVQDDIAEMRDLPKGIAQRMALGQIGCLWVTTPQARKH